MATRKITPDLEKAILGRAAEGHSSRAIAAWLKAEHGVNISHKSVAERLKQTRIERAEVAKAVVREVLTKSVGSDLDHIEKERSRCAKLSTRLYNRAMRDLKNGRVVIDEKGIRDSGVEAAELYLKAVDRSAKLVDLKLHYSGADANDEGASELAAASERVAGRLDRLADRLGPGRGDGGDSPDGVGSGRS